MKRFLLMTVAALLGGLSPLLAQNGSGTSMNIVGYYTLFYSGGDNWIANQLDNGTDNNVLNHVLTQVPNGSTFTEWDPAANQFLPLSVYSAQSQSWSINYSFTLFQGGVLHTPGSGQNIVAGTVDDTYFMEGTQTPFQYANYPQFGPGLCLLASPAPVPASFTNVVGRAPQDGEWVRTWDATTQTSSTTTFHSATGTWDNGDPLLAVGQSAFFDLGPVAVPEPTMLTLTGLGASLVFCRRGSRHRSHRA